MTRPYPVSCPICREEGSPNGKLKFDDEPENCRYHPRQPLIPVAPKSEKENRVKD